MTNNNPDYQPEPKVSKEYARALFKTPAPEPDPEPKDLTKGNVAPREGGTTHKGKSRDRQMREVVAQLFGREYW